MEETTCANWAPANEVTLWSPTMKLEHEAPPAADQQKHQSTEHQQDLKKKLMTQEFVTLFGYKEMF